jgi:hypothetical protein
MHVDHVEVEDVAAEEQDYEKIIEEYEEEIFVPKEFQEPLATHTSDFRLPKASPVHNPYFAYLYTYLNVVHLRFRNFMIPTYIYIYIYP